MAPTISRSESTLIFLSFSISYAFRCIRIFRSSTKLSSIFSDFEQAVYSIQRKSYKHPAEQLVNCILYAKYLPFLAWESCLSFPWRAAFSDKSIFTRSFRAFSSVSSWDGLPSCSSTSCQKSTKRSVYTIRSICKYSKYSTTYP